MDPVPPFPWIRLAPDPEPAGPEAKEFTDAEDAPDRELDWDDMNLRIEGGAVANEESGGRVVDEDEDTDDEDNDNDDCVPITEDETSLRRLDDGQSWTPPRKDARVGGTDGRMARDQMGKTGTSVRR
jgi:hypothetical protein